MHSVDEVSVAVGGAFGNGYGVLAELTLVEVANISTYTARRDGVLGEEDNVTPAHCPRGAAAPLEDSKAITLRGILGGMEFLKNGNEIVVVLANHAGTSCPDTKSQLKL